jgi:hypothetical protein
VLRIRLLRTLYDIHSLQLNRFSYQMVTVSLCMYILLLSLQLLVVLWFVRRLGDASLGNAPPLVALIGLVIVVQLPLVAVAF